MIKNKDFTNFRKFQNTLSDTIIILSEFKLKERLTRSEKTEIDKIILDLQEIIATAPELLKEADPNNPVFEALKKLWKFIVKKMCSE